MRFCSTVPSSAKHLVEGFSRFRADGLRPGNRAYRAGRNCGGSARTGSPARLWRTFRLRDSTCRAKADRSAWRIGWSLRGMHNAVEDCRRICDSPGGSPNRLFTADGALGPIAAVARFVLQVIYHGRSGEPVLGDRSHTADTDRTHPDVCYGRLSFFVSSWSPVLLQREAGVSRSGAAGDRVCGCHGPGRRASLFAAEDHADPGPDLRHSGGTSERHRQNSGRRSRNAGLRVLGRELFGQESRVAPRPPLRERAHDFQ